jgi:mannose-6-phosphate isomerase-like protein (cupin superfamily)
MVRRPADMRTEVRNEMRGGKGAVTIQHYLNKEDFKAPVRLCSKLLLPPGASIGTHPHEKEDEVFIIHRGQGVVEEGAGRIPVKAGDVTLTGRGGAHSIANTGTEEMEITAIIICYP